MNIHLPNSAFLGNIESFVGRLRFDEPERLDITMHPRWVAIHPMVLAMTAALGLEVRRRGGEVTFEVHDVRSLPYMIRLGLFDVLGIEVDRQIDEHEAAGRFIPLTSLRTGTDLRNFLVDMIPLIHAPPEQAESIKYVVSELVRNVVEHAGAPNGAIVCAQYFNKNGRLSIGVVDTGVGIARTIRASYPVESASDAIALALQPGITGTTSAFGGTEFNAGAGLFFVKSIATASKHKFVVDSDDAMFKLRRAAKGDVVLHPDPRNDVATWRAGLPWWPGTAVGIDLSIEKTIEFEQLLDQIRQSYFADVDDRRRRYKAPRFA